VTEKLGEHERSRRGKGAAGNGRKRHERREEGSAKANGLSRGEQIGADKKRKKTTREKKRAWGRTEKRE
jgi:hypothetical protein